MKKTYKSYVEFAMANPSFALSEGAEQDGDWEDEVYDWLSSKGYNVISCDDDGIIYSPNTQHLDGLQRANQ